jgi:hypothetical protein
MWEAPRVRRVMMVVALALLLVLDLSIVPLALAVAVAGGKSGQGPEVLLRSVYFLLVATVLGWLTVAVATRLRKPMQ